MVICRFYLMDGEIGKHDAIYGVFAEEEEEAPRYARAGPKRRAKYVHPQ